MAKLLACDLDGTLFYPKQVGSCISKKNVKFLQKWHDAGNKILLVTSRSYEFIQRLKEEIKRPFDSIVCNSGQIYFDEKLIRDEPINGEVLAQVLEELDEKIQPKAYVMTSEKYGCLFNDNGRVPKILLGLYKVWWFFQFRYREQFTISNEAFQDEIKNGKVYKIMTFFGLSKKKSEKAKEINKQIREEYSQIECSWTTIVNELTSPHSTKAEGVEYYRQIANIPEEDVYVVGDSGNDISMFNRYHENSYCMKHAYPSVKKYAKHTISRVYKLDKLVLEGEKTKC